MRKYQKVEKAIVLGKESHLKIGNALKRFGKTSVVDLTDEEREELAESLDKPSRSVL